MESFEGLVIEVLECREGAFLSRCCSEKCSTNVCEWLLETEERRLETIIADSEVYEYGSLGERHFLDT